MMCVIANNRAANTRVQAATFGPFSGRRRAENRSLQRFVRTDAARGLQAVPVTACPASTIFAGWRQSVLPVHLLGLAPLLGSVGPVAGDVKLQDDGVVHDPVNRRGGGHGVGKDALPLREDQV